MLKRQTSGSVVCPSCGRLVGVRDARCFGCGRWNPGLWGFAPLLGKLGQDFGFLQLVIGGCVLLYAATLLASPQQIGTASFLSFLSPGLDALLRFGMTGAVPVFVSGRWWTVLSATWLHGGALHIFFNLLVVRQLVPGMSELFGTGRLVIVYTLSGAAGFLLTSVVAVVPFVPGFLSGAPYTVGASASLFGLFGALLLYGHRTGRRVIAPQTLQFLAIWVIFGFLSGGFGAAVRFDNWAHLGGFGGGYLVAGWLDPQRPETQGHLLGALACLAATVAAIAASLLVPVPPLPLPLR